MTFQSGSMWIKEMLSGFFKKKAGKQYVGSARQVCFIVGTGRCGTTILAQVLNSHSRICVPHELQIIVSLGTGDRLYDKFLSGELSKYKAKDFIRLIEACCPYKFEKFFDYKRHFENLSYPQKDVTKVLKEIFDHICFEYKKDVFIEQTPWYGQKLDELKAIFPDMKVIHLIRDARDVAISFSRTPWWSKDVYKNLVQWEKEVNVIHEFGTRNPENFLEFRYEDLVMNPEGELKKPLKLLNLEFEKQMLDPERLFDYGALFKGSFVENQSGNFNKWSKEKKQVFFASSVCSWKKSKDFDFSNMPVEVVNTLEKFGYEI